MNLLTPLCSNTGINDEAVDQKKANKVVQMQF